MRANAVHRRDMGRCSGVPGRDGKRHDIRDGRLLFSSRWTAECLATGCFIAGQKVYDYLREGTCSKATHRLQWENPKEYSRLRDVCQKPGKDQYPADCWKELVWIKGNPPQEKRRRLAIDRLMEEIRQAEAEA